MLILVDLAVPADSRKHDVSQAGFQQSVRFGKGIIEPGAFFKFISIHIGLREHLLGGSAALGPHRIKFKNNSGCPANRQFDVLLRLSHGHSFALRAVPRYVRKDIELGGVQLRKGEKIMPMLAAANLDPQANPHPEKLDLARKPNRHLAFGTGIHFCLGHQLARLEGVCALRALFRRWPKLALAVDERKIKWRQRPGLKAIEQLPVAIAH